MSDNNLPVRRNPDQGTNEYGTKLLNLCRSTGLRIVNGRHKDGTANDFTFCGSRGMSVVDYLIVPFDYFHIVEQFIVSNFTSFSDPAPLHIRLQCKTLSYTHEQQNRNVSSSTFDSFRWNDDLKEQCYESLILNKLSSNTPIVNDTQSIQDTTYEELDRVITQDEILKCISKLKRGKSHGIDGILNELLIEYKDVLIPFLRGNVQQGIVFWLLSDNMDSCDTCSSF
ncbi:Hypothetical predicted protein [Mytilus galloprovincialis]|uniref:Reverse transcriptase domain-containing protein n=1 Tax=Mytilus galloprovincialis TaxID=29158 RepID=A0A8B6D3Z3_MYTGA|nr:Hypothetical predicted protein [Mytilus galloprovincialis]